MVLSSSEYVKDHFFGVKITNLKYQNQSLISRFQDMMNEMNAF